ncbi:hypothetical protein RJ640_009804 [Escallonia rubra]|uniref:TF-B3 domain-containing protein n=1 Tax=Escallonia rubra TaxID=112253 RepID=A0AA88QLX5_9ASTE|nr:hypothetical protein RJ640_009804 [Escallonia rubra]
MKTLPKKAHFFKFIQPCFKSGIRIPESFFKYLREEKPEQVMLRRGELKWAVTMNGSFFGNGWTEFAEDNGVEEGYFLVFSHEGDMVFDVVVFDQSTCEKEYQTLAKPSKQSEAPENSAARSANEDESNSKHSACLYIPTKFGRSHGLSFRKCEMILMYEEQSSWPATLWCKGKRLMIGLGCREFFKANGIAVGDDFKLELISNGKKPIMNFCHMKKERVTNCTAAKATLEDQPYYESILKPSHIIRSTLLLPKSFARRNCLSDGEMILIDEKERSWPVQMRDMGSSPSLAMASMEIVNANPCALGWDWLPKGLLESIVVKLDSLRDTIRSGAVCKNCHEEELLPDAPYNVKLIRLWLSYSTPSNFRAVAQAALDTPLDFVAKVKTVPQLRYPPSYQSMKATHINRQKRSLTGNQLTPMQHNQNQNS